MSEVLAAFVTVGPPNGPLHVVIPIKAHDKDVVRAMATVSQLRAWLSERLDGEYPYQEILAHLIDAGDNARLTIRTERLS